EETTTSTVLVLVREVELVPSASLPVTVNEPDGGVVSRVTLTAADESLPALSRKRTRTCLGPSPALSVMVAWLVPGIPIGPIVLPPGEKNGSSETVTPWLVDSPYVSTADRLSVT